MSGEDGRSRAGLGFLATALRRDFRGRAAGVLALTLAGAATEALAVLLLLPLLHLLGVPGGPSDAGLAGRAADRAIQAMGAASLPALLALYVAGLSAHALLARGQAVALQRLCTGFALRLRDRIHAAVLGADWLFLTRSSTAGFTQLLSDDVDRAAYGVQNLLATFAGAVVSVLYVALALQVSPAATALALASGTVLLVLLRGPLRASRRAGEARGAAIGRLFHATGEHFGGLKTARSYGAEERHAAAFHDVANALAKSEVAAVRSHADLRAAFSAGSALLLAATVYAASAILAIPAAGLLVLLFIFARLLPRFSGVQQSWQHLLNALPAVERIAAALARLAENRAAPASRAAAPPFREAVRFEDVAFRYGDEEGSGGVSALSLTIPARATTALTGPSGAGKTTVADLMLGLLAPQSGRITVDGVALVPEMRAAWRAGIGYVGQETFLLDATIAENLRLADPGADEERMWEALALAAADFVRLLPGGLDTRVGERGVRLSGGERQRLSLARALLRRPRLLVLDEATSALDAENEARIRAAVEALRGRMSVLVISHRPAMVEAADRVYLIEDGKVVGERAGGGRDSGGVAAPALAGSEVLR